MRFEELPPVPDRVTGEPRPPEAPRHETDRVVPTPDDREPYKQPPGPPDGGPVLEWSQASRRDAWQAAGFGVGIVLLFLTIRDGGFGWTGYWVLWACLPAAGAIAWFAYASDWTAAGATWIQHKKSWADSYDLVRIRQGVFGRSTGIRLTDAGGRHVDLTLREVQANPPLWDLVYNGIRHSVVVNGCDIPRRTCELLDIPTEFASTDREHGPTWLVGWLTFCVFLVAAGITDILFVGGVVKAVGVVCVGFGLWIAWKLIAIYRAQ